MNPALVFLHRGYDPYLEYSLRQARASNPDATIVLIGDASNDRFACIEHRHLADYQEQAVRFASTYRHRATNDRDLVLFCFQRWFIVREFMRQEGLAAVFVCDSDVLVYADLAAFAERALTGYGVALSIPARQEPYRWCASAHTSYWTLASLDVFCEFLLRSFVNPPYAERYAEKWAHHVRSGIPGGICDMTSLYFFGQEQPAGVVFNTATGREETVDDAMASAENEYEDEYRMRHGLKEIAWEGDRPVGFNLRQQRPVPFLSLHFQGRSKRVLHRSYRGPAFRGMGGIPYRTYASLLWKAASRRLRRATGTGQT